MRYWYVVALVLLAGCTSAWERQQESLAEHQAAGEYARAMADVRWMIDNAFAEAPPAERTEEAEGARYLQLARLAVQAGKPRLAIEALRQALSSDPHQASAVRNEVAHLPLPPSERRQLEQEFAWNIAALAPAEPAAGAAEDRASQCWSYRVHELHVHRQRTIQGDAGREREVRYDARPWVFNAATQRWRADGPWVTDAGTEIELIGGPQQPRYQAVMAADHEFYTDATVPACHRSSWQGPYDSNGTVFVAAQLPGAASPATP